MTTTATTPSQPPSSAARVAAATLCGLLLLLCADAAWQGLAQARERAALRATAAAVVDAVGQAAGRDAERPGDLAADGGALARRHGHRLGTLFATREGGVDEFGIARGGGVVWSSAALEPPVEAAVLAHSEALLATAAALRGPAAPAGATLPWERLTRPLEGGATLLAVPFRTGEGAPASGVAGVILAASAPTLPSMPWRWAWVLLPALAWLGLRRAGLGDRAGAITGCLLAAAAIVATAPALPAAVGGGVQILAAQFLVPHAAPPANPALAQAEQWIALALGLLALGGGAAAPRLAAALGYARRDPAPYLYVGPAVLATALLVFVPFGVGIGLSFAGDDREFVGIANYTAVLSTAFAADESLQLGRTFAHTVLWTVLNVSLHVVIGLGLALVLNRPGLRFRKWYRLLLIVPWAVPSYITALTWKWLFNTQYGPINVMLGAIGVERVDWLGSGFGPAFVANLATNVWLGFPFMMVISLGALQSIPAELYEAADIDGASGWQKLRHVTLPLLRPALFPAIILGTIWTFNAFNIIYLVSGGGPDHATEILITEAYYLFTVLRRTGLAAAYAVLIFVLLMAYTLMTNRATRATEAVDG